MREFKKVDGVWHRRDPGQPWERLVLEDYSTTVQSAARRGGATEQAGKRWLWKRVG